MENPFVKHDKGRFGKNLFRPKFTRFGHAAKPQWQQPPPTFDNPIDEASHFHRERVRRELASILKSARSVHDLEDSINREDTVSPRLILDHVESEEQQNPLKSWPSAPSLASGSHGSTASRTSSPPNQSPEHCVRCYQSVYPLEKIEPIAGQQYHPQCFRCVECGTKLTLATYCRSLQSNRDRQVYCRPHQPRQSKVMLVSFNARRSQFPAFKLSWQSDSSTSKAAKH